MKVLVISQMQVEERMRGVAIRSYEVARVLTGLGEVVLAAPTGGMPPPMPEGVTLVTYERERPGALRDCIDAADVVFAQPQPAVVMRWLSRSRARLIFDLYDPEVLENLAVFAGRRSRLDAVWLALTLDRLASALHIGHHFVCASNSQRDLWLGAMLAERVVSLERYQADPSFRSVLAVVPFGLDRNPPSWREGEGIRARFPTIDRDAEIVLWNGGIWKWLDPILPIVAIDELRARRERVQLVFMGGGSRDSTESAARAEASSRGMLGACVHFNDDWVPYDERASWLLEADCAVAAQDELLEARFAFRTRLLDCFWSGLPVVTTRGDDLARRVEDEDLGAVCDPGDAAGLARSIESVLTRGKDAFAPQLARVAREFEWESVCAPLLALVGEPCPPRLRSIRRALAPGPSQRARATVHQALRGAVSLARSRPRRL